MTARERLDRRKRWLGGTMLAGVGVTFAGVAAALAFDGAPVVALIVPGIALIVGPALAMQWVAVRCAGCGGNLSAILMRGGGWRIDPKLRHCPYCGAGLDAEPDGSAADGPEADAAGW